jgi:putative membrane protein insertion efficiency factor
MENKIKYLLTLPIKLYKKLISPLLPNACRFHPTCSEYCKQAINKHGVFRGLFLGIYRLLRCNPWGGSGIDEVPEKRG